MNPYFRFPWDTLPDVFIHAVEVDVHGHEDYPAAKTGDTEAAFRLVTRYLDPLVVRQLAQFAASGRVTLVSAHAVEKTGVNAIPEVMAGLLGDHLGWPVDHQIVQTNIVSHTRADGFSRLARQAAFGGEVRSGETYFLVDDFVGQGGTLANLRGWIMANGGRVAGATVLTGKPYSAKLPVDNSQIDELKRKHGDDLREWWQARFGFDYECLTRSEARYLIRTPSADRIRNRLAAAVEEGG